MKIDAFKGEYRWLSNFYPAEVQLDGVTYPSVENAYQAAKTLLPGQRARFVDCTASAAKRKGRTLSLREDWESVKLAVMLDLLRQKFAKNPLREQLLVTGSAQLIEGNHWGDRFWGVCDGVGENHLGKLLMQVRDELRASR